MTYKIQNVNIYFFFFYVFFDVSVKVWLNSHKISGNLGYKLRKIDCLNEIDEFFLKCLNKNLNFLYICKIGRIVTQVIFIYNIII